MKLRFLFLAFLLAALPSSASISFVGKCNGTTSCTPPAHQVGDLFIVYVGRDATTTAPTLASGWTNVGTSSISGTSPAQSVVRMACKVATTTSETVTGFTNGGALSAHIYRGQAAGTTATCASAILGTPVFTKTTANTTSTTETFGTVTNSASTSWDSGWGYAPAATGGIGTAPTGMTNRDSQGTILGGHDTNGAVSSFTTANVTLTTAGRIITGVVEIKVFIPPVCTATSYGNITCVNQFVLAGAFTCATQQPAAGLAVTTGNRIVIWVDNAVTVTGMSDTAGNSYVALVPETNAFGGTINDSVWTALATTTATIKFFPTCSGSVEMAGFQLHSSVGTVAVGCNSSSPGFVETASGTTVTSSCTSANSGLAFGFTDWVNVQPTADTGNGWALVNDTAASEYSFQLKDAQTTATCIWHEGLSDDFLSACAVFTDGSSVGSTPRLMTLGVGNAP